MSHRPQRYVSTSPRSPQAAREVSGRDVAGAEPQEFVAGGSLGGSGVGHALLFLGKC